MDAMTILRRCRASGADLEELDARIRQRRDAVTMISVSLDRDGGAGGSGTPSDRIAAAAAAVADLESRAARRRERQAVELMATSALSDRLSPSVLGQIIFLYYGKALTVRAVAKRVKYTEGYVRRLRRDAEDQLKALPAEDVDELLPPWYLDEQ